VGLAAFCAGRIATYLQWYLILVLEWYSTKQ
jgi:hypothetical protein